MAIVSYVLIGLAAVLTAYRLLRGPSNFDRLLSSDTLAVIGVAFLAVFSSEPGRQSFIDVALVYAVIGFVGVVIIARFLQGADR
jgi:multisubunit Na+/H+ antiporter MnhF subunit